MMKRLLLAAALFTLFVGGVTGSYANAQQSSFDIKQEIKPIDCTATRVSGSTPTECDGAVAPTVDIPQNPKTPSTSQRNAASPHQPSTGTSASTPTTVTQIITSNSRPVITGTFDKASAEKLSVTIDGRTYILGRDPELVAIGNRWVLDFSKGNQELSPGTYDIIVEVETKNGLLLRDGTKNELVITSASDGTMPIGTRLQVIYRDLFWGNDVILIAVLAALAVLIMLGYFVYSAMIRKNHRPKD